MWLIAGIQKFQGWIQCFTLPHLDISRELGEVNPLLVGFHSVLINILLVYKIISSSIMAYDTEMLIF